MVLLSTVTSNMWIIVAASVGGSFHILVKTSDALIMDVVMIAMAFVILLYGSGRWSLDSLIWTKLKKPITVGKYSWLSYLGMKSEQRFKFAEV